MSDKPALRRQLRAARHSFVTGCSAEMRAGLMTQLAHAALPRLRGAHIIASYAAYGDEIDPQPLEALLSAAGISLAFPCVATGDAPMRFQACQFADLVPGYRGILEPPTQAPVVVPDYVLVPLVGVDAQGMRIGQGGGHYDRALTALGNSSRRVGLAWDMQLVPRLPADPWDVRLDAIVTPSGWRDCAA